MSYFAHSPKNGIPPQTYTAHINAVIKRLKEYMPIVAKYGRIDGALLQSLAEASAYRHDLGKLEKENQRVLSGEKSARKLPYHHQDAGVAHYLSDEHFCLIAAVIISAHHKGLPNFRAEGEREERIFRDHDDEVVEKTNMLLPELNRIHDNLVTKGPPVDDLMPKGDVPVFLRLLLSCLVDADHTNTAVNYGNYPQNETTISLRPAARLESLDSYVTKLSDGTDNRDALRREMYNACRNSNIEESISSCDSPVGTGKTTAVMAHLLNQAQKRGLRRIFVVLPFTSIIQQSVRVYRKALVLPGENPEEIVAELHHRADFESEDVRHLSSLWRAPIIVTTAVTFFETLSSKSPSTLRRLHELPGSAVFVDEAHAALPVKLLPIAWHWMNIFADEWSCYWVMASGSLCRFWQIEEIAQSRTAKEIPEIIGVDLRSRLSVFEQKRITYKSDLQPKCIVDFMSWISTIPGPRLIILNTVQTAAVLADAYSNRFGRERTEHLSTALTPKDREDTLERVRNRLKNEDDSDWSLFATSCAEAGLDLSFRNGFRELGALVSLLQAAGRVNRKNKYFDAKMWTFVLAQDNMLKSNPGLQDAAIILRGYFEKSIDIDPKLSTDSMHKEIRLHGVSRVFSKLLTHEENWDFENIEDQFNVIESDTCIAIVDQDFCVRIRNGNADWKELQRNSVQIARYKLKELNIPMIMPDIYQWNLLYNNFLGYMAGIVKLKKFEGEVLII